MKIAKTKRPTDEAQITRVLAEKFAHKNITVQRYNWASIHVRVIDRRFHGKSIVEREAMVAALIDKLPDTVQSQLTILLLLSPKEKRDSLMDKEFAGPALSAL